MEIKNIKGKIIFKADKDNIKGTVEDAVKSGVNLSGVNLSGVNLSGVNLSGVNLSGANLYGANLSDVNLSGANLYGANLYSASLYRADLYRADLSGADLYGANLYGANLYGANLYGADLSGAKNIPFVPTACPSDGEFTGWKKVDGKLIELRIPTDAKRSSATTEKCRCDKASVVSITDIKTGDKINEIINHNYTDTIYRVGEMVYPDSFDEDRWQECSNGIHFFTNKESAINY